MEHNDTRSAITYAKIMRTLDLFRLDSYVSPGVVEREAGGLNLIYTYLLQEFQQDVYDYINVSQMGPDCDLWVSIEKKKL